MVKEGDYLLCISDYYWGSPEGLYYVKPGRIYKVESNKNMRFGLVVRDEEYLNGQNEGLEYEEYELFKVYVPATSLHKLLYGAE